jgi:orotidine-5'-phosphate decarboxylase
MPPVFADRLAQAVQDKGSPLVVGLDPDLKRFPDLVMAAAREQAQDPRREAAAAIIAFNEQVIEAVAPFACAVKPQIAYYEMWGPPGLEAYEHTIRAARAAGLLVIGDAKRGDIGSTATAYATAHLTGEAAVDSLTVNPYLGTDSVQPFLNAVAEHDAGLFILVRTSNPSACEIQDLVAGELKVHEHVARLVDGWGTEHVGACGYSSVGAVVGATAPGELKSLRQRLHRSWLLIPGVGAQGGSAADVACAFDANGLGAVVNSSRGILYSYENPADTSWLDAVTDAARSLRDELAVAAGLDQGSLTSHGA